MDLKRVFRWFMTGLLAIVATALFLAGLGCLRLTSRVFWHTPPREGLAVVTGHTTTDIVLHIAGQKLSVDQKDTVLKALGDSLVSIGTPLDVRYDEVMSGLVFEADTSYVSSQGLHLIAVRRPGQALN